MHVLRAPVGGLFRHVCDLVRLQSAEGHAVGIVADKATGGAAAEKALAALAPDCALGIARTPMPRQIGPGDVSALRLVARILAETRCDVVHGHGAKGGAYARLAPDLLPSGAPRPARIYTPHGGSLHYERKTLTGFVFLTLEKIMLGRTDTALFESDYARATFLRKVGALPLRARVVHNGVGDQDFVTLSPVAEPADFVFVGELRHLKGVDVLLHALAALPAARLAIVGEGPDGEAFRALADRLGLSASAVFHGAMPARDAFALGRCLVVPSRAESLPYIVLEALAAAMPVIASRVGGIPEILDDMDACLVRPGDPDCLAAALAAQIETPGRARAAALRRQDETRHRFHARAMSRAVLAAYRAALSPS